MHMKNFKKCIWLLVSLNRHKNIISRHMYIMFIHDMVLKTRFRANIQYWTRQNPENINIFRYMILGYDKCI